jgi:hypothetical protein
MIGMHAAGFRDEIEEWAAVNGLEGFELGHLREC